ncbi:MAG: hypothetical protein AAGB97_04030 [Dehalococcoidia bacterium]
MPDIAGPEQHKPNSLRGIANRSGAGNGYDLRGTEYNRGTGCGKIARPGLCGGRRVTGVPTAAAWSE